LKDAAKVQKQNDAHEWGGQNFTGALISPMSSCKINGGVEEDKKGA